MSATRVIITIRFPEVLPGKAVDGGPADVAHLPFVVLHDPKATKAAILAKAAKDAAWALSPGKLGERGTFEAVRLETERHNVPALEPEAWKRLQDRRIELERRMGIRA